MSVQAGGEQKQLTMVVVEVHAHVGQVQEVRVTKSGAAVGVLQHNDHKSYQSKSAAAPPLACATPISKITYCRTIFPWEPRESTRTSSSSK